MNRELEKFLLDSIRDTKPCESWNEFRKIRPTVNDLSNINLDKYRVSHADFRRMNFCGSKARSANFFNCDFSKSDLFDVAFYQVTFEKCNFTDCDFSNSHLQFTHFIDCSLRDSSFQNTRMDWPVFKHCNMTGAELRSATLTKADLREIQLIETSINIQKLDDAFLSKLYSSKMSRFDIPEARHAYVNKQFIEKSIKEICMELSVDFGINLSASTLAGKAAGPITTRILGTTLDKFLEMLCAVHNLDFNSSDFGETYSYRISPKLIRLKSSDFRQSTLQVVGQFLDISFGVSVKWDTEQLAQQRIDLILRDKSLREFCIEICKSAKVRVATHVLKQNNRLEVTEDREIDFNLVKHLHFYQV